MSDEQVSRREFLGQGASGAALGASLTIAGLAAAATGNKGEPQKVVALPFDEYRELAKVGGSAAAELPDHTEVLVAHVEPDRFVCVSLRCTHANCKVAYDAKGKKFVCPCHGSSFDLDGQPLGGPARKPLARFETNPAVVVKLEKK